MTFAYRPAVRDRVSLLIALAGASGSGKTFSGLKLARGLAGWQPDMTPEQVLEVDRRIAVVDTEAGRALHYAIVPGELPGPNRFGFLHGDLAPPFTPERYAEAMDAAAGAGAAVILIDSFSHEWEGEGGLHEIHDAEVAAAVEKARRYHKSGYGEFDEERAAEKANVGAWREPKARHKTLVNHMLQSRAHLVICLRADEKLELRRVTEGKFTKTVIVQAADKPPAERWTPICEKRFMYEMTGSAILTPQAPGVPIPIKIQDQHRAAFPEGRQLGEETGRALAAWARGEITETMSAGVSSTPASTGGGAASPRATSPAPDGFAEWEATVIRVLEDETNSVDDLKAWWGSPAENENRQRYGEAARPVHRRVMAQIKALEATS